jgi:multisubunit Na+/H+ antiporter MnhB subunit
MNSAVRSGRGASARLAEYALVVAIFLGSLVMWVGLPVGWLWLVTRLADHYPDVYAGALFGCPVTMVLFGLLLARLNALHLRLTGGHPARRQTAWLKSLSGDRRARPPRSVLDTSMVVSVVIAVLTMAVWYFFFAHSYTPGLPAP